MHIILFAGGWSSEREISLAGAQYIEKALIDLGHSVDVCDCSTNMLSCIPLLEKADFAFINVHGIGGEDGLLPALVERFGIPYQCSNAQGSFLALNKAMAKVLYRKNNLPTAEYRLYTQEPTSLELSNYPLFIKGNTGGSSIGLYRAENEEACYTAIRNILATGDTVIVEEAIQGIEVSCGVLGDTALPPVLIRPKDGDFFTYESKYGSNGTEELCPAPLPQYQIEQVMEYAYRAHQALGLFGYSRTDMIIQENGDIMLLESNTIPGMTATSLFPQEAKAIGLSFTQLIDILIKQGVERAQCL